MRRMDRSVISRLHKRCLDSELRRLLISALVLVHTAHRCAGADVEFCASKAASYECEGYLACAWTCVINPFDGVCRHVELDWAQFFHVLVADRT